MAISRPPRGRGSKVESFKVVLVGHGEDADLYLLTKTIAGELGVPLDEAKEIVEQAPSEIFASLPEEAAELFAEKISAVGGNVEVVALRLAPFSRAYPHKRARGKCKVTGDYICDQEIIAAGGRLLSAEGMRIRRRRIVVRTVVVAVLLVGAFVGWAAVRPTVMRLYHRQVMDRGVSVLAFCVANRPDMDRIHLVNDIGDLGGDYEGHTLWDATAVFNREFSAYTNRGGEFMTLKVVGLLETTKELPVPTETGLDFSNYFRLMDEKYELDMSDYTYVVAIDVVPRAELPFGDEIPQLSITSGSDAVVWFAADEPARREHYLTAFSHALGKLMGGTLKQSVTGNPLYPIGYPSSDLAEFQSSDEAELMAGYRPDQLRNRAEVDDVTRLRIGPTTAWEFGWITKDARDRAYAHPGMR